MAEIGRYGPLKKDFGSPRVEPLIPKRKKNHD